MAVSKGDLSSYALELVATALAFGACRGQQPPLHALAQEQRVLLIWIVQRESRLALMQSLSRHGLCQRPQFQHFAKTASREDKLNY